jgi:hypothetical protein
MYFNNKNKRKNAYLRLKYISLEGIRLEASGRLTKRLTASRALSIYKYKGSLRNVYSSFQTITSNMVKGYSKSNVDYLNLNSNNRIGSYGLKSYINSY